MERRVKERGPSGKCLICSPLSPLQIIPQTQFSLSTTVDNEACSRHLLKCWLNRDKLEETTFSIRKFCRSSSDSLLQKAIGQAWPFLHFRRWRSRPKPRYGVAFDLLPTASSGSPEGAGYTKQLPTIRWFFDWFWLLLFGQQEFQKKVIVVLCAKCLAKTWNTLQCIHYLMPTSTRYKDAQHLVMTFPLFYFVWTHTKARFWSINIGGAGSAHPRSPIWPSHHNFVSTKGIHYHHQGLRSQAFETNHELFRSWRSGCRYSSS
jgi:hypothetical protein